MPPRRGRRGRGPSRPLEVSGPTRGEDANRESSAARPGAAQEPPAWERAFARIADLVETQTRALEAHTRVLADQAREIQELRAAREAVPQVPLVADPPVVPDVPPVPVVVPAVRVQDPQEREVGLEAAARVQQSGLSAFLKLHPPEFQGQTEDPLAPERWLMEVDTIFSTMLCTDRQRVSLATFMLKGSAADWWATRSVDIPEGVEQLTWAGFRRYFLEEYFPFSTRQIVMQEFEQLTQGSMSVADYSTRFTRLSRFAPALVMDEETRCRRFELGLSSAIRVHVTSQAFMRYSDLVSRVKTIERDLEILVRARPPRSQDQGQRKKKRPRFDRSAAASPPADAVPVRGPAPIAAVPVQARRPETRRCYHCQRVGHILYNCPDAGRPRVMPPQQQPFQQQCQQ
ncbi:hypothetical protein QJS04_geneDACA021682 [Acorus gramineus]|uniref:CCHC-type domain-containing protein n=1 Tax=Acorus gramineus TaxID=55184 RepID=A0AAV9A0P3_ACOGR|nr:hypothetical protein QJS04_geneDACA021682 [Acorus gramineus]